MPAQFIRSAKPPFASRPIASVWLLSCVSPEVCVILEWQFDCINFFRFLWFQENVKNLTDLERKKLRHLKISSIDLRHFSKNWPEVQLTKFITLIVSTWYVLSGGCFLCSFCRNLQMCRHDFVVGLAESVCACQSGRSLLPGYWSSRCL